jgi:hypothetical protein
MADREGIFKRCGARIAGYLGRARRISWTGTSGARVGLEPSSSGTSTPDR